MAPGGGRAILANRRVPTVTILEESHIHFRYETRLPRSVTHQPSPAPPSSPCRRAQERTTPLMCTQDVGRRSLRRARTSRSHQSDLASRRRRPRLEPLEDRRLLAGLTANNDNYTDA